MADNVDRSILEFQLEEGANVAKQLDSITKSISKMTREITTTTKSGNIYTRLFGNNSDIQKSLTVQEKLQKGIDQKRLAVERLTAKLKELNATGKTDYFNSAKERVNTLNMEIEDMTNNLEEMTSMMKGVNSRSMGGFNNNIGNVLMPFSRISRSIGGFDSPLGAFGDLVDNMGDVADSAGQLKETFGGLFSSMKKGALAGAEGKGIITGLFGALKGGVGGLASGASEMIGAIGPAGAAFGAISITAGALNSVIQSQNRAMEKQIELRRKQSESEIEYYDMLENSSSDQLKQQRESLEAQIRIKQAVRDAEIQQAQANDSLASWVDRYRTVAEVGLNRIVGREAELATVYGVNADAVREYNTELDDLNRQLGNVIKAMDPVAEREREERALEELTAAREEHLNVLQEMADAEKNYKNQLDDFLESESFAYQRMVEDQKIADERALKEHQDELIGIEKSAQDNIKNIRQELADNIVQIEEDTRKANQSALEALNKSLTQLDESEAKQRVGVLKEYAETEAKDAESFRRDQLKAEEAYQRERLSRIKDAGQALLDAELANDVTAFISAQKSKQEDLDRMEEARSLERQEAQEAYDLQRQEAKQARDEQLEDIRISGIEQRQEMMTQYEEEKTLRAKEQAETIAQARADAAERITAEHEGAKASVLAAQEAWKARLAIEKEDRDLQEKRRKEDLALRLEEMNRAFVEEVNAMRERDRDAVETIRNNGYVIVQTYEERERALRQVVLNSYNAMMSSMQASRSGTYFQSPSFYGRQSPYTQYQTYQSGYGSGGGRARAFAAEEGIVVGPRRPTLVIAGEGDTPEMVMPLTKSGGIPDEMLKKMQGSTVFEYNGNMTIGDGVSKVEVVNALQQFATTIVKALAAARAPS